MGKLISIVGASGVGKTALVHALAKNKIFQTAYEQHTERPFQALFKQDKKYALANQMDYLLLRAEQEGDLRRNASQIGLIDGGLDLDFHGFTRLFLSRNLLGQPEFVEVVLMLAVLADISSKQKLELDVSNEALDYPHSTSRILEFIAKHF